MFAFVKLKMFDFAKLVVDLAQSYGYNVPMVKYVHVNGVANVSA